MFAGILKDTSVNLDQVLAGVVMLIVTYYGGKFAFAAYKLASDMKSALALFTASLACLAGWGGSVVYSNEQFKGQVESYVTAAYNTPSKEKAKKYIDNAISYLRDRGADKGFTSLVAPSQEDDLSEFFEQLELTREEMDQPEVTKVASLADDSGTNEKSVSWAQRLKERGLVTIRDNVPSLSRFPAGISRAPYNKEHLALLAASIFGLTLGGTWTFTAFRRNKKLATKNATEQTPYCPNCGKSAHAVATQSGSPKQTKIAPVS
jgi:hypothetical protein